MHGASKKVTKIGILAGVGSAFVINCRWCDARQPTGAPGTGRTGNQPAWPSSPADRSPSERVGATCLGGRKVARFGHAQWRKDIPLNVFVFWFAGELFDQRAKRDVVDVGIAEILTGTRLQRRGERTMDAFCFVGSGQAPR